MDIYYTIHWQLGGQLRNRRDEGNGFFPSGKIAHQVLLALIHRKTLYLVGDHTNCTKENCAREMEPRIVSSTTPFWGPMEVDELYTTSTPKAWTLSWFLVWIELGIFQGTGVSNFFQWKSYNFFLRRAQHLLTWIFSFLTRCICFPKKWKTFFFVLLFVAIVVWEYGIFALLEV